MTAPMIGSRGLLDDYGRVLKALRLRCGLTQDALGRRLHYGQSRVSYIESGRQSPTEEFTRLAEAALSAGGALWERWEAIDRARLGPGPRASERDLSVTDLVAWLADHSPSDFTDLYVAVAEEVEAIEHEPAGARHARAHARSRVTRADIARLIGDYYGPRGLYAARVDGLPVGLGVFTRPDWLRPVELGGAAERVRYREEASNGAALDDATTRAAIHRLAAAEVAGTVMVNNPLYRLRHAAFTGGGLEATFSTVPFAAFALGADMLEAEAIDGALGSDMPLRQALLPDTATVYDLDRRACVGGVSALVAVARDDDYVIFTHERASRVVNGSGKLGTIPQAFHQPHNEAAGEVLLSTTLGRELEEELLGRADLEEPGRQADALHAAAASEPMAWLRDRPGSLRQECTGLCINGGAGNFVFACLVVVEDPEWWVRFGHRVEANWEAQRVVRHSTRDTDGLVSLIHDPRWTDIGMFPLLQGLSRLSAVGDPQRVAIPAIELL